MKKRFFSSMFFAACFCASMSMFVSCKDYDDDINNLQEQITTNASTLDEMVKEKINNLTIEIEALKAQDATLETALANAKSEFEQAVADAKSYADIQAAAAQAAAIEASKKNIEEACALLQASIDAANAELDALSSKVSTQEETINGLLNADKELQSAIDIANGEIQSAKDMAIAAQQKADENADILNGVIENLATVKGELDNQISALGDKIDGALEQIAANKAAADAQLAEVNALISRDHILRVLKSEFAKSTPNDEIIFVYSGHGVQGGLTTYETKDASSLITYNEIQNIMKSAKARRKVILAMACYSGGLTLKNSNGGRTPRRSTQKTSVMLYTSSRANEVSWESPDMTNSFFISRILEAFRGAADRNGDRKVTARELFNYVNPRVISDTEGQQHPQMWGKFDDSMVVVYVK